MRRTSRQYQTTVTERPWYPRLHRDEAPRRNPSQPVTAIVGRVDTTAAGWAVIAKGDEIEPGVKMTSAHGSVKLFETIVITSAGTTLSVKATVAEADAMAIMGLLPSM